MLSQVRKIYESGLLEILVFDSSKQDVQALGSGVLMAEFVPVGRCAVNCEQTIPVVLPPCLGLVPRVLKGGYPTEPGLSCVLRYDQSLRVVYG